MRPDRHIRRFICKKSGLTATVCAWYSAKIQAPSISQAITMKKSEMIDHIAQTHTLTKVEANRVLDTVIGIIHTDLKKEGRCSIPGLG
ncbi:MAG: HU family DNA-binding protein, partial [Burkholderiaceae bacterium]